MAVVNCRRGWCEALRVCCLGVKNNYMKETDWEERVRNELGKELDAKRHDNIEKVE